MKRIYAICIILVVLFAGSLSYLALYKDMPINYLLVGFVSMNAVTLLILFCGKLFINEDVKIVHIPTTAIAEREETVPIPEVQIPKQNFEDFASSDWSAAMYVRFSDRWNDLFNNIQFPLQDGKKSEINVLCWEIASLTMDYLLVKNNDVNVLERNKYSVDSIIRGLKTKELDLKEFFEDPTTVPAKVLAVYNTLCSDMVQDQKFTTQIFGYLVDLERKDEH